MKYLLTIILLTLLTANSFSQLRFTKEEKLMIKCVTAYEKENLKRKYRREDGLIVLVFRSTKYVISLRYVDEVYLKIGKEWIKY